MSKLFKSADHALRVICVRGQDTAHKWDKARREALAIGDVDLAAVCAEQAAFFYAYTDEARRRLDTRASR